MLPKNPKRNYFSKLKTNFSHFAKTPVGVHCIALLGLILFTTFTILSIPIFLYRFILAKFVAPYFFHGRIGQPVASLGNLFTADLLTGCPPRCAIVTNMVVEGTVSDDEARSTIENGWLKKQTVNGERLYPELQQYIESWMGFMFWKEDDNFDLHNHLIFHQIKDDGDINSSSEKFLCEFNERLLNQPFRLRRSPWEVHVVRNYFNSQLKRNGRLTVIVLRFHHGLADGFSILFAVMEGLFGTSLLSNFSIPITAKPTTSSGPALMPEAGITSTIKSYFVILPKLYPDIIRYASFAFREFTPWHVSDKKKKWKQLYGRSNLISLEKLKATKNRLGSSFTGVLLSSIAAGVSQSLHSKSKGKRIETLPALIPLPLAGHPQKLINHSTAVIFDLPVAPNLDPLERLQSTEESLQSAKNSTVPFIAVAYGKILGSHLAPVAKKLLKNRFIPMGLSNFPGPAKEIVWNGKRGLSADFVAGAVTGVAGVGFMVLSYGDFIRITVSAENAIMEKEDVSELVRFVENEIESLSLKKAVTRK